MRLLLLTAVLYAGCGCKEQLIQNADLCIPEVAAADTPLFFEAGDTCGNCKDDGTSCEVSVGPNGIALTVRHVNCHDGMCAAVCERHTAGCRIPSLAAGAYPVTLNGAGGRTIRAAAGGDAACALPPPAVSPR